MNLLPEAIGMALANLPKTPVEFVTALRAPVLASTAATGIPPGFVIAQAALETGYGKSVPTDLHTGRYSYNLFGVKWSGQGDFVETWTREFENGQWVKVLARFRAYSDYQASLDDHARLLLSKRYRGCLRSAGDAESYARCVARAGYATDPRYADKVIDIMRRWNLLNLQPLPFPDVAADDYAAEAIAWCKDRDLMVGRDDGRFYPDDPVTRRELAIVVKRLHDLLAK